MEGLPDVVIVQTDRIRRMMRILGTAVGVGFSMNNIARGKGTGWDYADIGVGSLAAGAAISNPIGLAVVGVSSTVYFGYRTGMDWGWW